MFNERSLQSKDFAINLVSVMTSRQMEKFEINGTRIRYSMLSILQKNFQSKLDNIKLKFFCILNNM